jgi:DNA-binding MarR family transcriptional regulator
MTESSPMLGALLRIPFQAIVDNIYTALIEAGYEDLRPPHFIVFQHMRPEGVRAIDLADKAQITKPSMSYLVNYLEERGYVERAPDPSDGRAQLIRLTAAGKDVERIARESISKTQQEWAQVLGEVQMAQLFNALQSLAAYLDSKGS